MSGRGYVGKSMSTNAAIAYEQGERPLSKWTKQEIVMEVACSEGYKLDWQAVELMQKLTVKVLREKFLVLSGRHHTSKYYNETEFYRLNNAVIEELTVETINSWSKTSIL